MEKAGIIHPKSKLVDTRWDMRKFTILNGDENLIRFGEALSDEKKNSDK